MRPYLRITNGFLYAISSSNLPTINNQQLTGARSLPTPSFHRPPLSSRPTCSPLNLGEVSVPLNIEDLGMGGPDDFPENPPPKKKNVISFRKMCFFGWGGFSKIFRLRSTDPRLHHLKLGEDDVMTSPDHAGKFM